MRSLSGLNAAGFILWSRRVSRPGVAVAPHKRVVLSSEADKTCVPSSLNSAQYTGPVWPLSATRLRPDVASQTRAVLSAEAVTMRVRSGLNAAHVIPLDSNRSQLVGSPKTWSV